MSAFDWRGWLHDRGITDASIAKYGISWHEDHEMITLPLEGDFGKLFDPLYEDHLDQWRTREGAADPTNGPAPAKTRWSRKLRDGEVIPPFPSYKALADAEVITEGEWDCIILDQWGIKAATGTAGAGTFKTEWAQWVRSVKTLLYDNDPSGWYGMVGGTQRTLDREGNPIDHDRVGAARAIIEGGGPSPLIARWPSGYPDGFDVTDWWRYGRDGEDLRSSVLSKARPWSGPGRVTEVEPAPPVLLSAKELPTDAAGERALLGSVLLGGRDVFLSVGPLVSMDDFSLPLHKRTFGAMQHLFDSGAAIDPRSVVGEMRAAAGWSDVEASEIVGMVAEVPTSLHAETYAQQVRRCGTARRIVLAAQRMASSAMVGGEERTLLSDAQAAFDGLFAGSSDGLIMTPGDLATAYFDVLDKRQRRDPAFIGHETGFGDLDRYIAWRPGELAYIIASPGTGKTALLKNMQDDLARRGVPSLFASAEQPWMQIMDRTMAADTSIDSWRLARGNLREDEFGLISNALGRRIEQPAYLYWDPVMTTARVMAKAQEAKMRYGVRVVFIDYVQRLSDASSESEYIRITNISRRLAQMAMALSVCVVAACQVNRKGAEHDGQIPTLAQMRDSGNLEADAFIVLSIGRKKGQAEAQLSIEKNRNGLSGIVVPLQFDAEHVRFMSLKRDDGVPL